MRGEATRWTLGVALVLEAATLCSDFPAGGRTSYDERCENCPN